MLCAIPDAGILAVKHKKYAILPNPFHPEEVYATKIIYMRAIYRSIALIITSVFLFQCQKDLSYVGSGDQGVVVLPDPISSNLTGNVFDENGQPASGVQIAVGSKTATTDNRGYFRINNASLDKNASLVTAEKSGYFKAYRSFGATSGTNQVVIKLVKKTLAGTINAATGGEVSLSNGTRISLPANGVVLASNSSDYTGTINVYASYIDPTSSDILQTVPGSFMANNKDGKRVLLSSYGMMAVELESSSAAKLQIKSGTTATLTSPIPTAAQGSAPASISLWYVDEATGLWKEEGTAAKQGNNYVGTVKHFTYWNCDMQLNTIQFTATLVTSGGQPLVHASVVIRPTTGIYYGSAHGYTDSLGQVSGPIPANLPLLLEVHDQCDNVVYSQNIGPFSQNTNLGTITVAVSSSSPSLVIVKGKLLTCSNTNVVNGYAIISIGNWVHYAGVDANGNFITNFLVCGGTASNVQVLGIDATNQQQSNLSSFAITQQTTDVGNITACGTSAAQFINYTIDGTSYNIGGSSDSLTAYTQGMGGNPTAAPFITNINGFHNGTPVTSISLSFSHPTQAAGTYPATNFSVQNYNQTSIIAPFNVIITNYPAAAGQFYEGTFSGSFGAGGVTHTASGSFKVRRNF
jgi:hypothetical protein